VREICGGSWKVKVQYNPDGSSAAAPGSIRIHPARPCFLCQENLPSEQRRSSIGTHTSSSAIPPDRFGHFTIARMRHLPQSILENREMFLRLATIRPGMTVFYNGPRAGASAPDHLHFQAAPAAVCR